MRAADAQRRRVFVTNTFQAANCYSIGAKDGKEVGKH